MRPAESAPLTAPPTIAPDATVLLDHPHRIEETVRRHLLSQPDLRISSLVIRRVSGGVCLEGVLEADENVPDVSSLVRAVTGVEQVLNHLVVRRPVVNDG